MVSELSHLLCKSRYLWNNGSKLFPDPIEYLQFHRILCAISISIQNSYFTFTSERRHYLARGRYIQLLDSLAIPSILTNCPSYLSENIQQERWMLPSHPPFLPCFGKFHFEISSIRFSFSTRTGLIVEYVGAKGYINQNLSLCKGKLMMMSRNRQEVEKCSSERL